MDILKLGDITEFATIGWGSNTMQIFEQDNARFIRRVNKFARRYIYDSRSRRGVIIDKSYHSILRQFDDYQKINIYGDNIIIDGHQYIIVIKNLSQKPYTWNCYRKHSHHNALKNVKIKSIYDYYTLEYRLIFTWNPIYETFVHYEYNTFMFRRIDYFWRSRGYNLMFIREFATITDIKDYIYYICLNI
jgi:hypothetical protein